MKSMRHVQLFAMRHTIGKTICSILVVLLLCGCSSQSEKTVLTVWYTEVDPNANTVMDTIVARFEKSYPNVHVEHNAVAWGDLNKKLINAFLAGGLPDLTHLEPFMTASLYEKGQLLPIDDVIADIGADNIFPAVRDLQLFDGKRYGIAYAVGATFFAVRRDLMAQQRIDDPKTWDEFLEAAKALTIDKDGDGKIDIYGLVLPGTPFFIDQFATELVASNGGYWFEEDGTPSFESKEVIEMLRFFKNLSQYAPPDWTKYSYLEQFQAFAANKVAMVPVCYARALKNIEQDADSSIANGDHFGFIPQPHGPSGKIGIATMDCENWAVLKGGNHPDLAKEFLKFFYQHDNYLAYCQSVPIQLTPIISSIASSPEYLSTPMVHRWNSWQMRTNQVLQSGQALPILMCRPGDRKLPFLMEIQGRRIITDMVLSVCQEGLSPEEAAARAQQAALEVVANTGDKH